MENYMSIVEMKNGKKAQFKTYYNVPTQVMFYEADPDTWSWGIAYKEDIICACCGAVLHITEIIDDFIDYAEENEAKLSKPIYEYRGWCDFVGGIYGYELPDELEVDENEDGYCERGWSGKNEKEIVDAYEDKELIDKRFLR